MKYRIIAAISAGALLLTALGCAAAAMSVPRNQPASGGKSAVNKASLGSIARIVNPMDEGKAPESVAGESGGELRAKLVKIEGEKLLLADAGEGGKNALWVDAGDAEIAGANGKALKLSELKEGMLLDVSLRGGEGDDGAPSAGRIAVKEQGENLVGFYLGVIGDLYEVDPGLNGDISLLAFDMTELTNLSESEKAALLELVKEKFGLKVMAATYKELCEKGLIDDENLWFEDGLLFTLSVQSEGKNKFTFEAEKWRSGLGAYFFTDCKAYKAGGEWTYDVGAEAIA